MATARTGPIRLVLDVSPDRIGRVLAGWPSPAFLESGRGFGEAGRWSFLTARPRAVFEATGDHWRLTRDDATETEETGDPLAALAALTDALGLASPADAPMDPDDPPFQSGLVGFLGYDLAPRLERLPRKAARDSRLPDIRFALHDTVVVVDHLRERVELWARDLLGEGVEEVARRAHEWKDALESTAPREVRRSRLGPVVAETSEAEYVASVRRALEYIAAGDIFQVNLSQRFVARGRIDPFDLYLRLEARSAAPFAAFLRWGDLAVASASPEWFHQTRGEVIVTRPIKGTRPRSDDPEEDRRLAEELLASAKDRAELTMIVDLERNDLGRVCQYGSIQVVEPHGLESFPQVHHLVATIVGRLRPEVGPVDVARAMFPGGSITGAPKIRAMEIIDELEPTRRGLYTGAIGYLGVGGASAFNIAIRTLVVEGDRVSYQVGGGIVADSDPVAEYQETLHKGRGLRDVLSGR